MTFLANRSFLARSLAVELVFVLLCAPVVSCGQASPAADDSERLEQGLKLVLGKGVAKDVEKGRSMIADAAEGGDAAAQFALAMVLAGSNATLGGEDAVLTWLEKAAAQGYPPAQTSLGNLLWEKKEWDRGREWLIKAAGQGDAYAQYSLGQKYHSGVDGEYWRYDKAIEWLTASAEQGFVPAQTAVGLLHTEGDFRTHTAEADYDSAVRWLRPAADAGNPMAMTYLGFCYIEGHGVARDERAAVALWQAAAKHNYSRAEESLGWAYEKGRGVSPNPGQARAWYRRAASHGSQGAKSKLDSPEMTRLRDQEIGAAVLLGLLAIGIASAGNAAAAPPADTTSGTGYMDMTDPNQLWGATMMMDIK